MPRFPASSVYPPAWCASTWPAPWPSSPSPSIDKRDMKSSTTSQIDPTLAAAAAWTALLRSGTAAPEEFAAFEAWRSGDPGHEAAAQRIGRALMPLDRLRASGVPGALMRDTL